MCLLLYGRSGTKGEGWFQEPETEPELEVKGGSFTVSCVLPAHFLTTNVFFFFFVSFMCASRYGPNYFV